MAQVMAYVIPAEKLAAVEEALGEWDAKYVCRCSDLVTRWRCVVCRSARPGATEEQIMNNYKALREFDSVQPARSVAQSLHSPHFCGQILCDLFGQTGCAVCQKNVLIVLCSISV